MTESLYAQSLRVRAADHANDSWRQRLWHGESDKACPKIDRDCIEQLLREEVMQRLRHFVRKLRYFGMGECC
jgi:hypothetical protein